MSPTIKFTYLIGALKGEAHKLVQGFEVNDQNYTIVINLLTEKFENKDKRKRTLVQELLDINLPHHSLKEISLFHDNLCRVTRCLKPLAKLDEADWLIREMILRKLPIETQKFLFGKFQTTYLSSDQIVLGLSNLIEMLEAGPKVVREEKTDK